MSRTFNMAGGGGGIKLAAIAIITPPARLQYRPGQTFDPAGMVVQAIYDNGATVTATGWTYSPSGALTEGTQSVTILYTEGGVTAQAKQDIAVQKASIAVPTQIGTLTYTGGPQAPTWSGYDPSEMTLGGVTSGINAGNYNATFTLLDTVGTEWADGTSEPRAVAWSIQKAPGSLSLFPTSMTLDNGTPSKVITVTRSGTGAITAQSSAPGVASISVSGNQVMATGLANGSATITISVAEDLNYTAPAAKTCSVQVNFIPSNFSDATWAQIISACQNKEVPDTWVVGNFKDMTINGKTYRIDIIGKNHDPYATGGNAPITFQMHDCYEEQNSMNNRNSNSPGWTESIMRTTHLPAILNLMPSEVRTAIREVEKETSPYGKSTNIEKTNDKLFLLSEFEVFGIVDDSNVAEGSQYAYYQAGNSKIKYLNGTAETWWLRSPANNGSSDYCNVASYGGPSRNDADYEYYGIAFAFCF